jgi:poly-gamma-glutamate synthesis protein (capsule biosynthesis protein)
LPAPPPPPPPPPEPEKLTLVVTGDLMAHIDQVEDSQTQDGGYDFNHVFEQVKDDLSEGYAIGNLETVFGGPQIGPRNYPQFSTPDEYGYALKENGFDFVSTCNNHSLDWYEDGALRTIEILDEIGLAHTGTYRSEEERSKITVVDAGGFKLAILAFTFSTNGIPMPQGKDYLVNMLTEERLITDLQKARALEPDLIAVMPHMGNEYEEYTREAFLYWMDLALYHGADFVFASHPHVLQPMMTRELTDAYGVLRTGFIIASLGNFVSGQRDEPRDIGVILKVDVSKNWGERPAIERVRFVPTWVQYREATGQTNIRVLPVGDALKTEGDTLNPLGLTADNYNRLRRANDYITAMFLGEAVPVTEEPAREYVFYERDDN